MDFSSRSQPQNQHEPQQQIQSYDSPQIQFNYSYSQPPNNVYHDQPDYSNAYQSAPLQHLPEAAVSNPLRNEVAVAQFKEADGANLDLQHPSAYYPALNPAAAAAVVALSHLAQFAGTMDAAERAVVGLHAMVRPAPLLSSAGQFPYMDGGRRGGGAFRGGGHGKFGHRNSPSFYQRGRGRGRGGHGRGRGRGGPKHFSPHDPKSSASQEAELKNENAEPSTDAPEKAAVLLPDSSLAAAPEKVVPSRQPTNAAWCELCRVNCTSLEILEQHKNGKRHKKNLLRTEELRKIVKPITEVRNEEEPVAESRIEASQYQEFEQGGIEIESVENIDKETVLDENKTEADNRNNEEGQSEVPAKDSSNLQAGKPRIDFDNWKCGMKRKMKGARGGKLMKRFAGSRQQTEPPKPKVVIPLICDLCNVKCDTREVLDRHLSGKKHIAKLKRFESHQAMYGPIGVQSLYPPNPIAQTLYHAQGHHQPPVYDSKGLYPPSGPYMPPQSQQPAVTSAGMNHAFQHHYPIGQTETADASGGHNTVLMVSETQQQVSTTQPEIRQASVMEANDHIVRSLVICPLADALSGE